MKNRRDKKRNVYRKSSIIFADCLLKSKMIEHEEFDIILDTHFYPTRANDNYILQYINKQNLSYEKSER